jgi:hypothetical protein
LDSISLASQVLLESPPQDGTERREIKPGIISDMKENFQKQWKETCESIPLPGWCDSKTLVALLTEKSVTSVLSSRLRFSLAKANFGSTDIEDFLKNVGVLKEISETLARAIDKQLASRKIAELRSDLDWSTFSTFYLYLASIKIFNVHVARRCEHFTLIPRGTRTVNFRRQFETPFLAEMERLLALGKTSSREYDRIRTYLRLWNASGYQNLGDDLPYLRENIDSNTFDKIYSEFETALFEFRESLFVEAPESFKSKIHVSNSTSAMLSELVTLE